MGDSGDVITNERRFIKPLPVAFLFQMDKNAVEQTEEQTAEKAAEKAREQEEEKEKLEKYIVEKKREIKEIEIEIERTKEQEIDKIEKEIERTKKEIEEIKTQKIDKIEKEIEEIKTQKIDKIEKEIEKIKTQKIDKIEIEIERTKKELEEIDFKILSKRMNELDGGNKKTKESDKYTVKQLKTLAFVYNVKSTKKSNGKIVNLKSDELLTKLKKSKIIL